MMYFHDHQNDTVCNQPLSPTGGESCSYLPEELIVEILLILPVRSLLQFKCICKSWKTLISDPFFVKRHLRFSAAKSSLTHKRLLFSDLEEDDKLLYYPLKQLLENLSPTITFSDTMKQRYWIIGSCNGLLCQCDVFQHCVRLWNPSIRFKSNKSPAADSLYWRIMHYGFGYDQVNDKYKVLLIMRNMNDSSLTLTKVYTFGDDSWKIIQNFHLTPTLRFSILGIFVSGTLNWIIETIGGISFDLEKETYKEISLPRDDGDTMYGHALYVLNDCLGVCYVTNKTHWVAWLMKEYGVVDSWTKFMIIPLYKFNNQPSLVVPLFIAENGVVLLEDKYTTRFLLYNLNSGQFTNSLDDSLKRTINIRFNIHIHCESLVSLPW